MMTQRMAYLFQKTIDQQRDLLGATGISAVVILPDGTTWLGVSGMSSDSEAMLSSMIFGLGIFSKTYIVALVLQFAKEGAFSVEDSVGQWFPELDQTNGSITIRQLLNHTSGLHRYQLSPIYMAAIFAQPERVLTA